MKTSRKVFLVTALAAVLGLGAAVGAHQAKQTKEVEAAVTNGKYRINVFVDSDNWSQDNIKTIFNAYSNGDNQQMGVDADLPVNASLSNYNDVTDVNGTSYRFQTFELSARTALTKNDTTYVARSSASTDWWDGFATSFNLYTQFRSKYWDNTFKITGTWNNFSATLVGWYNKVCLHTGLNLQSTKYVLLKSDASPSSSDQNIPTGYVFDGWYTDSALSTPWTSGSQYTDINLYAKYEAEPANYYDVKKYEVLDGVLGSQIGETESVAEGTNYAVPDSAFKSGYTFGGWYTTQACSTPYSATTVNADLNIYAKYTSGAGANGNVTIDLKKSGWADAAANYAVCFMDKTTYSSTIMEWSTYVTGVAANEHLVTVPYNIGFEPEELLVYRYKPSYSQADWEAEQFATGDNKWGQTKDVAFNEHLVIGTYDSEASKNSIYTGYARVLGAVAPAEWTQIELLDSIKSNDSHHVEYYSDSVTLAAGCEFKIVIGNNEYYGGYSTHSSIASDFSGDGSSNITAIKGGTYSFYFDSVSESVYITDPVIADADEWAQSFNKATGCSATKSAWGTLAGTYAALVTKYGDAFSNIFKNETHVDHSVSEGLSYVAQAVQRYDYVLELYGVNDANTDASGYQDFIGRVAAGKVTPKHNARANIFGNITDNNSALLIAGIAALLAASAVAGYFFIRRKQK